MQYNFTPDMKLNIISSTKSQLPTFPAGTVFPSCAIPDTDAASLPGPGTRLVDGKLVALRLGTPFATGQFTSIRPISVFYEHEVNDVVIGRVTKILPGKYILDINSTRSAVLKLDALNLPGLQRQRTSADETNMRLFLQEGDLICVEMRQNCQVHTRNQMFGKLSNGILISVPVQLMRGSNHFVSVQDISVILATNGFVWVSGLRTGSESAVVDGSKQEVGADILFQVQKVVDWVEKKVRVGEQIDAEGVQGVFV